MADLCPTHKVSFWGVRCYLNNDTGDLWGVNRLSATLLVWALIVHHLLISLTEMIIPGRIEPGYPFKVLEEYKQRDDNV